MAAGLRGVYTGIKYREKTGLKINYESLDLVATFSDLITEPK